MYRKNSSGWVKHIDFIILDLLCVQLALYLSYVLRQGDWKPYAVPLYWNMAIFVELADIIIIFLFESYKNVLKRGYYKEFATSVKQAVMLLLLGSLYLITVQDDNAYSRTALFLMSILYCLITYGVRLLWKRGLRHRMKNGGDNSLIIITSSTIADAVVKSIKNHNYEMYQINGVIIADKDMTGKSIAGIPVVANAENAAEFLCQGWVDEVFINIDEKAPYPRELIERCTEMGLTVHLNLAKVTSNSFGKQSVGRVGEYTVLTTSLNFMTERQAFMKRTIDILAGLAGCLATGIIFIFIAPIIYISSPGPIFFTQERVGQNGKLFKMYKFRSMYMDAEERKAELMKENKMSSNLMFKMDFDPRIIGNKILPDGTKKTGVGQLIRSTSLDEFPQFLNVLLGNRSMLVLYDALVYAVVAVILLVLYGGNDRLSPIGLFQQAALSMACIFVARLAGNVYGQVWRYGGIQCYIRLLVVDAVAFIIYVALELLMPVDKITFARMLSLASVNTLGALSIRMMYRYAYKCGNMDTLTGRFFAKVLKAVAGIEATSDQEVQKIKVAIIGAGRVGVGLAEELLSNAESAYLPRCFVDANREKAGRSIHGIPVWSNEEATFKKLVEYEIQEIIFAIPNMAAERKKVLYERYKKAGYKVKVYDFPTVYSAGGKRQLREFDIEELLFRKQLVVADERTNAYYKDKVILITGGGGSIGSELCRQLAKMNPKKIIILDIYENGAYDVQQELKIAYGDQLNLQIEICSITHKSSLEKVFQQHRPQIIINAAAHKHVPLMEHNCVEAIYNNVFGTQNLVELCEKYEAERFMMVSTDKAVNPTNVMGATKRMCEMIVQSASTYGKVKYSATRFGNVLGSAGSVIPLFKRQIANGGSVTLTDKRIIRYFMTIPEASQLVLQSGTLAENGELFVLDMGKPIRILDLAENMIRLSGVPGIEIIETGLRPGEKLFEELLVKTEELDKTSNSMIFVERDVPLSKSEIDEKMDMLKEACDLEDDDKAREALRMAVPTFRRPEEINKNVAENSKLGVGISA